MTNLIESQRRRLLRHGFGFLFIGLWLGIATATLPHPRAWMAAHLTAFFTCLVLVAIGLVWRELRQPPQREIADGVLAGRRGGGEPAQRGKHRRPFEGGPLVVEQSGLPFDREIEKCGGEPVPGRRRRCRLTRHPGRRFRQRDRSSAAGLVRQCSGHDVAVHRHRGVDEIGAPGQLTAGGEPSFCFSRLRRPELGMLEVHGQR